MHDSQGRVSTRPAGIGPNAGQNSSLRPHRVRRRPLLEDKDLGNSNIPEYIHNLRTADSTRPKGLRQLSGNRSDTRRPSEADSLENSAQPNKNINVSRGTFISGIAW